MSVLNDILDIEHRMFMEVNAAGDPECRKNEEGFRLHRSVQFSVWSKETLNSYLDDLKTALECNKNLMTYKYARMDDLIPSENNDPLVEAICEIQIKWQLEIKEKYPELMKNARGVVTADKSPLPVSFARYLSAELESYSSRTLQLLYNDILDYKKRNINMSEKVYEKLTSSLGYESLDSFSANK